MFLSNKNNVARYWISAGMAIDTPSVNLWKLYLCLPLRGFGRENTFFLVSVKDLGSFNQNFSKDPISLSLSGKITTSRLGFVQMNFM